jgi:hypothetical protein
MASLRQSRAELPQRRRSRKSPNPGHASAIYAVSNGACRRRRIMPILDHEIASAVEISAFESA